MIGRLLARLGFPRVRLVNFCLLARRMGERGVECIRYRVPVNGCTVLDDLGIRVCTRKRLLGLVIEFRYESTEARG